MRADGKPINAVPEDPAILRALLLSAWSERDHVVAERNNVLAERDALAEQNERLQHLLLKLTRLKFGTKAERLPDKEHNSPGPIGAHRLGEPIPTGHVFNVSAKMLRNL
jgi:transposase